MLNYKNTAVSYTVSGKGNALVLLHGFLENKNMWQEIEPVLAKKYKVVCIDLLGHGATENYRYIHTMEEQANMVKAVLDQLHLRKYVLVGHSMGGYVALAFTKLFAKHVKGLCLMNSTALPDTEDKKLNRNRAIAAVKQDHKSFVKLAIPMLFSETNRKVFKQEIKELTQEALQLSKHGIIAALEGMKIRENQTNIYQNATFPILMIIGKQDPALDYQSLISQTKNTNVNIVEFPDGHMSYIENKEELISALSHFIKTCQ